MSELELTPQQIQAIDQMFSELEDGTHYGLLNVPIDASAEQIRRAYYSLSRQWHPDRFFRKEIGDYADRIEMVFVGITQAYQDLKRAETRKTYDRDLRARGLLHTVVVQHSEPIGPGLSPDSSRPASSAAPDQSSAPTTDSPSPEAPAARRPSLRDRLAQRRKSTETARKRRTGQVRSRAETKVRKQVEAQLAKGKMFFEQGQEDYKAGRIIKAAGDLELAVQFAPQNREYRTFFDLAKREARRARVQILLLQGEQAESYQQYKQAITAYREAVRLKAEGGKVYYRLARLVRHEEQAERESLNLLREAVLQDPDVLDYRLALGEFYAELGLRLNAKREYQEVLKREKGHEAAKAALKAL